MSLLLILIRAGIEARQESDLLSVILAELVHFLCLSLVRDLLLGRLGLFNWDGGDPFGAC